MLAVVQRVREARVDVGERLVGSIGHGLAALIAVKAGDSGDAAAYIATKLATLRIFGDDAGRMNLSVQEVGGRGVGGLAIHALRRDAQRPPAELYPVRPAGGSRTADRAGRRQSASAGHTRGVRRVWRDDGAFTCQRRSRDHHSEFGRSGDSPQTGLGKPTAICGGLSGTTQNGGEFTGEFPRPFSIRRLLLYCYSRRAATLWSFLTILPQPVPRRKPRLG